jgi:DNA-directed RNA polymerase specialized sigma24 family protein
MAKNHSISSESFDLLLTLLDPDRVRAADKYEELRTRLIRFFSCRGCFDAEDLTDEAFNRVTGKVHDLIGTRDGDPAPYFYGVAWNIFLEWNRERHRFSEFDPKTGGREDSHEDEEDPQNECLESCLSRLPFDQRSLVIEYYIGERSERIAGRKKLAEKMILSSNALQVKVLRIRTTLRSCVNDCLARQRW